MVVIRNNTLDLSSTILTKSEQTIIKNSQLKTEEKFAKSAPLYHAYRGNLIRSCFQYDVSEYPSDLINGGLMYHSAKSEFLTKLEHIAGAVTVSEHSGSRAVVGDLSVIINAL